VRNQQHSPSKQRDGVQPALAARRLRALAALPILIVIVGCGVQTAEQSGPTPGNTMPVSPNERRLQARSLIPISQSWSTTDPAQL
jgi:hypothetical protein